MRCAWNDTSRGEATDDAALFMPKWNPMNVAHPKKAFNWCEALSRRLVRLLPCGSVRLPFTFCYRAATTTIFQLNKILDSNTRREWFHGKQGARTGIAGTYGKTTIGRNVMPVS
jgi:hypothetical protein